MLRKVSVALLLVCAARADLSSWAYRALGQPDLKQNGLNRVEGPELNLPSGIALDSRPGPTHLYVADTSNHRVLCWRDATAFQNGDPPDLILGQPNQHASRPMGIGLKGLNSPAAVAVDPGNGNLYVADTANHRVVRYASPFDNPSSLEPDAVYGQADSGIVAPPAAPSQTNLNGPRALAFDAARNLWIADTGFHRLLRYPAATLDSVKPVPDAVLGQPDFTTGAANRGAKVNASGFDTPRGLAFGPDNSLYVSDSNNARVLKFPAALNGDVPAVQVIGQPDLTTGLLPARVAPTTLGGPAGLAVDSQGNVYVAIPAENRVLVFAPGTSATQPAKLVFGQSALTSGGPNGDSFPSASANSLSGPLDVKLDAQGNLFIADSANNRVLAYAPNSRSASRVLGQVDFSASGANQVKPSGMNAPFKIVVDYSTTPFTLYVSDTGNHRILAWRDAARFRTGDPADFVIGQPDLRTALANIDTGVARKPSANSLSSPKGMAVDSVGNLYVADSGNNRVLRYPRPATQSGRIAPDIVFGQRQFTSSDSSLVSASSLKAPSAVAVGPDGDIFVSDTGNNRVLEYPAGSSTGAAAIRVFGQPDFFSNTAPAAPSAQTLNGPQGIAVDVFSDLFVADAASHRVVGFLGTRDAPAAGAAAGLVLGNGRFDGATPASGPAGMRGPTDVAVGGWGDIYVSDTGNNRVLAYPSIILLPVTGAPAGDVAGQTDLQGNLPNWNSPNGLATPEGLSAPAGIFVDRQNTLYVADAGNFRVVHILNSANLTHAANPQATAVGIGAMASLTGSGFATEQATGATPLPNTLSNRTLLINDQLAAALFSIDSGQVSFQVPWLAPIGPARFAVQTADTGELVAAASATIASFAPELFTSGSQGNILNEDGSPNTTANPAARGSYITLTGTGQGQVSPLLPDGQPAPTDPPALTVAVPVADGNACLAQQPSVCVAIGSAFGEIKYSRLAPGQIGVWQLQVKVPTTASPGPTVPLRVVIGGSLSNIVNVSIK